MVPRQSKNGPDDRLITLDAMRGLAALAVAAGHLDLLGAHPVYGLAVDFFFMLSGYVLLKTYDGRLGDAAAVRRYLLRRAIRLVPLFVVGCMLGAIAYAAGIGPSLAGKPLRDCWIIPLDPPAWSLVYEAIASVAIGLGLWRRPGPLQWGLMLLGALGIVIAIVHNGTPNGGWSLGQAHYGVTRMLFGFSIGAVAYRFPMNRTVSWPWVIVPFVMALLSPLDQVVSQIALALVVFPFLLRIGAVASPMPFGRALGELSYPLYILHTPLYWLLAPWPPIARLGIAIVVSIVVLKLIDQPLRDRLLSWGRSDGAGTGRPARAVAGS